LTQACLSRIGSSPVPAAFATGRPTPKVGWVPQLYGVGRATTRDSDPAKVRFAYTGLGQSDRPAHSGVDRARQSSGWQHPLAINLLHRRHGSDAGHPRITNGGAGVLPFGERVFSARPSPIFLPLARSVMLPPFLTPPPSYVKANANVTSPVGTGSQRQHDSVRGQRGCAGRRAFISWRSLP
jgi:hypothetical protein